MSDLDLIPRHYRRGLQVRVWLRMCAAALLLVVVGLVVGKLGLGHGIRTYEQELAELRAERQAVLDHGARLQKLRDQKRELEQRLRVLSELREGVDAPEMFLVVDRALDENVWFSSWRFQRAGEFLEQAPGSADNGYFLVNGNRGTKEPWRVRTRMEIEAHAVDHSSLARFVRRLMDQPEIEDVRVLTTRRGRGRSSQAVDFGIVVLLKGRV